MAKYLNANLIFQSRVQAGELLTEKLLPLKLANPVVIALPRGGVEVAAPIAKKLGSKVGILVSKKIGHPGNPELAIGAVTSRGDYVIAPYIQAEAGIQDYIKKQIDYLVSACKEREERYLSCMGECKGRFQAYPYMTYPCTIILVDDGIATGMTVLAAIKSLKKEKSASLILAVPVISSESYDQLIGSVNQIITLKIPKDFIAVGVHYHHFEATTDEKISNILSAA